MQKWEYKTYLRTRGINARTGNESFHRAGNWDTTMENVLNQFGNDGWELVSVVPRSSFTGMTTYSGTSTDLAGLTTEELYVFKRPKA